MTTLTIGTTIQGWYNNNGLSALQNNWEWGNTATGNAAELGGSKFRTIFAFDLSSVSGTITAGTLRLGMELAWTTGGNETLAVWDITSPQASVLGGTGGVATYADAGGGISYGSVSFAPAVPSTITLTLNAAGLAALNAARGGTFILGADLASAGGTTDVVRFGGYQGHTANQLVLTTATVPAAPSITGFTDDSGTPGDALTNDTTPTLTGVATAGSTVTIRDGLTILGTTTAHAATGAWSFTAPTLADGAYSLTATATADGLESDPSAPLLLTVDTTPPPAVAVTLAAGYDGGVSATDGYTAGLPNGTGGRRLVFEAQVNPGETVGVGMVTPGSVAATATADGNGLLQIPVDFPAGSAGLVGLRLTRTDAAGNQGTPFLTFVSIDDVAPVPTFSGPSVVQGTTYVELRSPSNEPYTGDWWGFMADDLSATLGTVTGIAPFGTHGAGYRIAFTPDAGVEGSATITLRAGALTDRAGNSNAPSSISFFVDTLGPSVTLSTSDATLGFGETATVTLAFNEAVTGLTLDDLTATGGTLSNLAGSGGSYTATFTPNAGASGTATVALTGAYADTLGNPGTPSAVLEMAYDTRPPVPQPPVNSSIVTAPITFTLGSNIALVGLDAGDFSATLGAVTNVSGGGTAWAITYTPPAATEGTATVTLNGAGYGAANGAAGVTISFPLQVDTRAPTVGVAIGDGDALLNATETTTVTFTFSEAVTGLSLGDLSATGGTLSDLAGGGAVFTALFTPTQGFSGPAGAGIAAGSYTDIAGNGGAAGSVAFAVDTVAPDAPVILALSPDSDAPGDLATRNAGPVTLSGTAEAGSLISVTVDGVSGGVIAAGLDGAWSVTFSGLADGPHAVSLVASDLAGNASLPGTGTFRLFSRVIEHTGWVGANDTTFEGDWGNDTMMVVGFGNHLIGSGGDDVLRAIGTATIDGGAGDDVIELTGQGGRIIAGSGDDVVTVNANDATIDLGPGHDSLTIAGGSNARVTGGPDAGTLLLNGHGHQVDLLGHGHDITAQNGGGVGITVAGGGNEVSLSGWGNTLALGAGGNDVTMANGGYGTVTIQGGGNTLSAQGIGDAIGINGGGNTVTIAPNSSWTALAITGGGNTIGFASAFGHLIVQGGGNTIETGPNGVLNTITVTGGGYNVLTLRELASTVAVAGDFNRLTLENTHYSTITLDGEGNSVVGSGMSNTIRLGAGEDNTLLLDQGFHTVTGTGAGLHAEIGAGGNTVSTGEDALLEIAGAGFNTIRAGDGATLLLQGVFNDIAVAGGGFARLDGPLTGGAHFNTLRFGDGGATVQVTGGGNTIIAGDAGPGVNSVLLDGMANSVTLGDGMALVLADGGFNRVATGDGGASIIMYGTGNVVTTGDGGDLVGLMEGGGSASTGGGRDQVSLGAGTGSVVDLGAGDDSVVSANNLGDVLTGGAGADIFAFTGLDWNGTRITDFTAGEDRLDLQFLAYAGLTFGDLVFGTQGGATTVSAAGRGTFVLDGAPVLTAADFLFA